MIYVWMIVKYIIAIIFFLRVNQKSRNYTLYCIWPTAIYTVIYLVALALGRVPFDVMYMIAFLTAVYGSHVLPIMISRDQPNTIIYLIMVLILYTMFTLLLTMIFPFLSAYLPIDLWGFLNVKTL